VLWGACILTLTSIPNPDLPLGHHLDKVGHFFLYGVFGLLAMRAALQLEGAGRAALRVLLIVALFGAADEWHQQFIPGRSKDPADWLADTLGGTVGVAAAAARLRREPDS
jgi:VanZ family protein